LNSAGRVTCAGEGKGFKKTERSTFPWYDHEGRYLLHLGLSYNRQFIDVRRSDSQVRFSARPETYLTDRRAAATGVFFAEGVEMLNPELAWVAGPLSFQSEYFRTFIHSAETGNPVFWGW
jgi:phosphate-selective porin